MSSNQRVTPADVDAMMRRYGYPAETRQIIAEEKLLPTGLLSRLHATYPQHSGLLEEQQRWFAERGHYEGLDGFRQVVAILERHGIHLWGLAERELFVEVYRFRATQHALNSVNWQDFEHDSMFQLMFPQPGMMKKELFERYAAATSPEERSRIASDYVHQTNPHDAHQLLNKAWMERGEDGGGIDLVEGSQHKYPQCMLIFDQTTQECFAFCTYCFRHAQVRGDHDMFIQEDVDQVHTYLRGHPEVTDLLITGGDAGYMPVERLRRYVLPIVEDQRLLHVHTLRLGSRMLTYEPERILTRRYEPMLELFDQIRDNGLRMTWMAHFSTPRELLNPSTIAAVRRLQAHGVDVRSQSPIMNHISLFTDAEGTRLLENDVAPRECDGHAQGKDAGSVNSSAICATEDVALCSPVRSRGRGFVLQQPPKVDVDRSAQNWIDLGNLLASLDINFHSMYCARATGEHHYFTVPLADINRIFSKVFRSLASLNRPSRYITMTTSAGKLSILGVAEIGGRKAFALKFNEARNMEWMDRVFLAQFDEITNRVDFLTPFDTEEFFFEKELREIEETLVELHKRAAASDATSDSMSVAATATATGDHGGAGAAGAGT